MRLKRERYDDEFRPELSELELAQMSKAVSVAMRTEGAARRSRVVWFGIPVVALVAAVTVFFVIEAARDQGAQAGKTYDASQSRERLELPDGSEVQLFASGRLRVIEASTRSIHVALSRGAADFDVVKQSSRRFVVDAAGITVVVVGTRFRVAVESAREGRDAEVEVAVTHGRVQVQRAHGDTFTLEAGERWTSQVARKPAVVPAQADADEGPAQTEPSPDPAPKRASREGSDSPPPDDVDTWMREADGARLRGEARRSAALLRRVIDERPSDPRAPYAAFKLGRLLLDALRDPAEAAKAFALAERGLQGSALAEDALARWVDALARAGDKEAARERASDYLRRFPQGRWRTRMQSHASD